MMPRLEEATEATGCVGFCSILSLEALAAIAGMNGRDFNGHTMTVRLANNDTTGPYPRPTDIGDRSLRERGGEQRVFKSARNAAPPVAPVVGGTNLYVSGLPPVPKLIK